MFGLNYLKHKLIGGDKEVPANEQFYSPLRIAMHSTVTVSMIDWLGALVELNKSLVTPQSSMSVLAIGTTESEKNKIFNFYLIDEKSEEFTLQLFCSPNDNGKGTGLREAILYRTVFSASPLTEDDWAVELNDVGKTTFELDGNTYNRVWMEDNDGKVQMLPFDETVLHGDDTLEYVNNYMMYSRKLTQATHTPQEEILLVGVEETNESAEMVYRIGLNIPLSAVEVQ